MKCDNERINEALRLHQLDSATSWQFHPTIELLHRFFDLFDATLFPTTPLPPAALSLDRTRRTTLGHYVPGRNGTGVRYNINLNSIWLGQRSTLDQLVTLAHEMIHLWQDIYGKPSKTGWYHNREFCRMAANIGIPSLPPRGQVIKITDPFLSLCREHGIDDPVPDFRSVEENSTSSQGSSTLKKWSCQCRPPVNVRVAIADFDATCNRCGRRFERSE